jgi:hypothetical protein
MINGKKEKKRQEYSSTCKCEWCLWWWAQRSISLVPHAIHVYLPWNHDFNVPNN